MHARRATTIIVALALGSLAACGSPAPVRTLDDEPDLARIANTIPKGFLAPVAEELRRLKAACTSIDPEVRTQLPQPAADRVLTLELNDAQCQWLDVDGEPQLIVGTLESAHGGTALDETTAVLTGERSVGGVGERAVFDLQTRTLYTQENGRLWYLQLVGSAPGAAARAILTSLGRALVQTPSAR
jgi:hypothetical protein